MTANYLDLLKSSSALLLEEGLSEAQKEALIDYIWDITKKAAVEDFYTYVKVMAPILIPGFKTGRHIEIICQELQDLYRAILENDKSGSKAQVYLPPESMKPLSIDTLVTMGDGTLKRLGDISVGDTVITHRGRSKRVTAVHEQGRLPVMRLKTDKGREVVSAFDHPFLTPRGWVEAQNLKLSESLAVLDTYNTESQTGYSDDDFLMAGYFIGDGSIGHASITCYDEVLTPKILEIANRKGWHVRTEKGGKEMYFSGGVRKWFDEVGIPRDSVSGNKRVPEFVFQGDKRQVALFLGAYFDCDGCISEKKTSEGEDRPSFSVFYESKSEGLLRDVQHLLSFLGIDFRLRSVNRQWTYKGLKSYGIYWYLGSTGRDSCARFCDRVPLSSRKQFKAPECKLFRQEFDSSYLPDILKEKIVLDEALECRCLTVEEDHSFVANGLVVHNTVLCSHLFPSWLLGKHPDWRIIAVGHSADHAAKELGANTKRIVTLPEYSDLFPKTKISRESPGSGFWKTTKNGYYFSGGHATQFPGKRANLLICDDVVSEQTKPSELKTINANYGSGLESRLLEENSGQLIVNCLVGDTAVTMDCGGQKPIKDIQVGERVLTWNHGKHESKLVEAVIPQGEAEVFEIVTSNTTIRATDRHPFLCAKTLSWIRTEDLKPGDELLISGCRLGREDSWFVSKEEAWLTGFMMGDGWTIANRRKDNNRPRYVTCVAKGEYEDLNDQVLGAFKTLYGVTLRLSEKEGYYRTDTKRTTERLIELGVEGNAHTKRVPRWIFDEPYDFRKAYLEGFIDADGHTDPRGMRIVGLCNRDLVQDIKTLAESLGYRVSNIWHKRYTVTPPNSHGPIEADQYRISIGKTVDARTFTATKVKSVTKLPEKEEVWDLTVADNHNFFAEGAVCHNTRWYLNDISGYLETRDGGITPNGIESGKMSGRPWRIVRVPAILDEDAVELLDDGSGRFTVGGSYWPERKSLENLLDAKRRLTPHQWNALYLQNPIPLKGSIFEQKQFRRWNMEDPPEVSGVIISLDTAFSEKETKQSAESCYQIWGIFARNEVSSTGRESTQGNMILLGYDKGYWSFPELKEICMGLYQEYQAVLDFFLVENRASGISLIQELRDIGLPVVAYNPDKDKTSRAHSASAILYSGRIYINQNLYFTQEFLAELQKFPGAGKDTADAFSQAVLWMKDNWLITPEDYTRYGDSDDDDNVVKFRRPRSYWSSVRR